MTRTSRPQLSGAWDELVGDAGEVVNPFGCDSASLGYTFERDGGPLPSTEWQQRLRRSLPRLTSVPTDSDLAERVKLGIVNDRAEISPLVILVEENGKNLGEQHAVTTAI